MREQSFGSMVAGARARLSITRNNLAERLGVCGPTITRIELGQRSPSIEVFVLLVHELKLDGQGAIDGMWAQASAVRDRLVQRRHPRDLGTTL